MGEVGMSATNIKGEAHRLVENLPDGATWDDLMYQIYVRQAIEAGLEDSDAGRVVDVKEVRARFGLSK
jgi:predicted transcriptional regulator